MPNRRKFEGRRHDLDAIEGGLGAPGDVAAFEDVHVDKEVDKASPKAADDAAAYTDGGVTDVDTWAGANSLHTNEVIEGPIQFARDPRGGSVEEMLGDSATPDASRFEDGEASASVFHNITWEKMESRGPGVIEDQDGNDMVGRSRIDKTTPLLSVDGADGKFGPETQYVLPEVGDEVLVAFAHDGGPTDPASGLVQHDSTDWDVVNLDSGDHSTASEAYDDAGEG